MLSQIIHRLTEHLEFRNGRAVTGFRHRLLLMIDEFPSLGRLDLFAESLSLVAGYGIKACLIAQDLTQIHAAYGHDEAITSNCHTRVAFAPNRIETARLLSQMTGDTTVRHAHRTISNSGASTSEPEVARPLLTPDEAMRLGSDEALIFTSGRPAIRAKKLRYYAEPFLKRLAEIPPAISDRIEPVSERTGPTPAGRRDVTMERETSPTSGTRVAAAQNPKRPAAKAIPAAPGEQLSFLNPAIDRENLAADATADGEAKERLL